MRKTLPIAVALSATLLLAGCAGASGGSASPDPTKAAGCRAPSSGKVSDSVTVEKAAAKKDDSAKGGDSADHAEPKVSFDSPLKAGNTQRTVVTKGHGRKAEKNRVADVALAVYNGSSGKKLTANGFDGKSPVRMVVGGSQYIPGITDAIECLPTGSRAVTTMSVKKAFGNADPSNAGLKKKDSVVFVADVVDVLPTKATGTPETPKDGFPTVKLGKKGVPSVTIPKKQKAPAKTELEVLKKGDGDTVGSGDMVALQYQGVNWRTGKVFDQSWGRSPLVGSVDGFVPGFTKAVVGQKVGSQILVVIAPKDGYGSKGNAQAGIKGTDSLVFVIDILGTQHAG